MTRFCCILLLCLFVACTKDPEIRKIDNLNDGWIGAFGHGGMGIGFKYPVDSYESFEPCMRIGADGTEMDLQMTKDSLLILFHDQKLKDATLCNGIVNDKNWDEIKNCILASPYSSSIHMITAADLLDRLDLETKQFTFDCKLYRGAGQSYEQYLQTFARALVKLSDSYGIKHKVFIESSDSTFLRLLKNQDDKMKLFIYPGNFDNGLAVANKMDLYGITIASSAISAAQVTEAHRHKRRITVWNVETEHENIKAVEKNVDYIQSDKIIHLLKMFGRNKN